MTLLLTGLRFRDCAAIKWVECDLGAGTVHRPSPKGGPSKSFTLPLAAAVVSIFRARRDENARLFGDPTPWVFPRKDGKGPVNEGRWGRVGKSYPAGCSPHRLRNSFASCAFQAGVDPTTLAVLLNHRPPSGSVTMGYVNLDLAFLRAAVERIANALLR